MTQPRDRSGRFGPVSHREGEVQLVGPEADRINRAATVVGDELAALVADESFDVRGETTINPNLTQADIDRLSTDPEWVVRAELVQRQYPGVADRLATDVHPAVRLRCLECWDLDPDTRARLEADPDVASIRRQLTSAG